jgi:hypothetical protein
MVKLAYWKSSGVALGTGLRLPQQLRQLDDVRRDPPRLIAREQRGPRTGPIVLLQLQFCLALQLVFVLDAIIVGQSTRTYLKIA